MNIHLRLLVPLCTLALLSVPECFAQTTKATPEAADEPVNQEVEITEDNYRQFMELKGARQQRNVLPENAFKPGSGLQKLDDLPEESQKHLRNQLREIIVQGDQWQPGDEASSYPYVPSQAASSNEELKKQEAEAWGELVDSYHKREAQIYENADRTRAAMASEAPSDGGSNTGNGSPGDGTGQAGSPGQTGSSGENSENRRSQKPGNEGTYSPGSTQDPNASNGAGVSQNAMEFLQGLGQAGGNQTGSSQGNSQQAGKPGDGSSDATAGDGGAAEQPGNGEAQAQTGQQQNPEQTEITEADSAPSPINSDADNAAGSAQNALEFLQASADTDGSSGQENSATDDGESAEQGQGGEQDDGQDGDQSGENPEPADTPSDSPQVAEQGSTPDTETASSTGSRQNALEYLKGEEALPGQEAGESPPNANVGGTLSIQDLLNAQGIGSDTSAPPPKDKNSDEKDSGGNDLQ